MSSLDVQLDLAHLRRQAKQIFRNSRAGDSAALAFLTEHAPGLKPVKLAVSQLAVARSAGFSSWVKLKEAAEDQAFVHLLEAISAVDLPKVRSILRVHPRLAARRTAEGETLLHAAVWSNSPELAKALAKGGAPLNEQWTGSAHTPLSWAITTLKFEFARALVRLGDEPDLFCAAGMGDLERVKAFWSGGSIRHSPSKTGSSRFSADGTRLSRPPESDAEQVSDALYITARSGRLEVAKWLLDQGADPNFRGFMGGTSLHWAAMAGVHELNDLLATAGGDELLEDYWYQAKPEAFGIIILASFGMYDRLKERLDTDPTLANARGRKMTALHAAVLEGQKGTTWLLLDQGADRSAVDEKGRSALDIAKEKGNPDVLGLFGS